MAREQAPSHRCVEDDGKAVAPAGRVKRPMREDQVTHSGKARNRGEGACSRWGAQRPQNLQSDCFRRITLAGLTTAAQPSGSKLPRHRCVLDDGKAVAPAGWCKRPMREDQVTHSGKARNRGEGACSRWGAQRPQNLQSNSFRRITLAGLTTAAQPSGSKLSRHRCVLDDGKAVAPAGWCKRPMREDQVTHPGKASNCGEGACSRWGAQRPQNLRSDSFRRITLPGLTTAAQPSGSKLPRHSCVLDVGEAVAPCGPVQTANAGRSGDQSLSKAKIAAFGSSYRGTHSRVGAAEGCDLLI